MANIEFPTEAWLEIPELADHKLILHGFGTRRIPPRIPNNKIRLMTVKQVHKSRTLILDAPQENLGKYSRFRFDSMITNQPGIALGIRTADCLPVLLFDPETKVVGALHAGWRGTGEGIAQKVVGRMGKFFGSRPVKLRAGIGPGIGHCCYEVGEDVVTTFRSKFSWWADVFSFRGSKRPKLDLARANTYQLLEAGLKEENIYLLDLCTYCRENLFFSFRRNKEEKQEQLSFIALK
ncbi:MAG: peptidoglycan editing factor PgeF [Deltaproteobacteria bacterium]|nr:MAG: peptidoglycan editing factor PgeF [Deltaproteobacteria bacterium]